MRQYVDNRVESFLHARDVMESEGLIEEELEQFTAGTGPEEPGITLTDTVKPKKKPKRKSAKEVKVG